MRRASFLPAYAFVMLILAFCPFAALSESDDTLLKVEGLASFDGRPPDPYLADLVNAIEADSVNLTDKLIARLRDKNSTKRQLAAYVLALGLARQERAVDELIRVHRETRSEVFKEHCLAALALIGGKKSGDYLLSVLDATVDADTRLNLLNVLAQMKHEEALPRSEEILKLDSFYYWQSVFFFGKMGDKAIPFLLTKIDDKDVNVRANAITVLGQWLIATEAANSIEAQFWKEDESELRELALSSLENTIPDVARLKSVLERVIVEEKNSDLVEFASEAIDRLSRSQIAAASSKREVSAVSFQKEYAKLFTRVRQKYG
ncbi:hypothetical protein [Accumulibacter sp.]|uniref:HEAT repeat domain-containing protein n=1 Tax=Accumulibacter sp. TaxID=2053492 RepID=UPI00260DAE0C|nr:hypothetical protein [Accumulibacter sp.]